jgi:hypothetical protein
MMLAQGVSVWLDAGYLPELAPLLALSLVGAFVHLGARALAAGRHDRRRAMGVAVLTAAALMSPYLMLLHAFYIHVNLAAAVYLFLAVACLWSAEREAEKAWLTLGFVFLAGFALQRVEAIGLVLALIAMAWSRTRLDDHAWRPRLIVGWLCALVWHVEVWQLSGPAARILTPDRLMVLMAGIAAWAGALVLLARPALARWRPRLAPAMLTGLGLATLAAAAANPRGVWASLGSLIENSVGLEWGGLWPVMTLLALASLPLLGRPRVPPPGQWLFAAAAFGQVAFVIMLSALRNLPYTPFWQDSGNRMLIHATPLLLFWLMLVYGPVVVSSGRADGYTARAAPSPVGARESPSFGALRDTRSR